MDTRKVFLDGLELELCGLDLIWVGDRTRLNIEGTGAGDKLAEWMGSIGTLRTVKLQQGGTELVFSLPLTQAHVQVVQEASGPQRRYQLVLEQAQKIEEAEAHAEAGYTVEIENGECA